jgi:hypothetical protein
MPVVAIAFQGTDTKAHHKSPDARISETHTIFCPGCDLTFVALVDGSRPLKELHLEEMKAVIQDDCVNGLHEEKYILEQPD